MDGSFDFRFSLFPGDLVEIEKTATSRKKQDIVRGYYVTCDIDNGKITLSSHDRSPSPPWDKKGQQRVSTRQGVLSFRKYQVDPLGEISPVGSEKPPFVL